MGERDAGTNWYTWFFIKFNASYDTGCSISVGGYQLNS
jgi:hypothetical protein